LVSASRSHFCVEKSASYTNAAEARAVKEKTTEGVLIAAATNASGAATKREIHASSTNLNEKN